MMKENDVKSDTNVFKSAVDNTVELKDGYCRGHKTKRIFKREPENDGRT